MSYYVVLNLWQLFVCHTQYMPLITKGVQCGEGRGGNVLCLFTSLYPCGWGSELRMKRLVTGSHGSL